MSIFSVNVGLLEGPVGYSTGKPLDRSYPASVNFRLLTEASIPQAGRSSTAAGISPFGSLDPDRTSVSEDVGSNQRR